MDKNRQPNKLINEKSPYLLQHAYNPVDWHPWGEEAFEKSRREDKPIFLSIGYSTCHWCHVMEQESFEDEEVAKLMNDTFVSIKVDREERPDIDGIYMTVCQLMTGRGGWPLTIIMTPHKKPFYSATYIPKHNKSGITGMMDFIPKIKDIWKNRQEDVLNTSEQITEALCKISDYSTTYDLDKSTLKNAYVQLLQRFDKIYGGFSRAPKFPTPHNLIFLLRYWKTNNEYYGLDMVKKTLDAMRCGGIYDHIGSGFHRYSTDERWFLPHFEKMLYDQALLSMAFIEAYEATGEKEYELTAREIFTYILRDMTSPEGGFYSAEDADSEGQEGKFYLWKASEIREILDEKEADLIIRIYNIEERGNFLDETTGMRTGGNILYLEKPFCKVAAELKQNEEELRTKVEKIKIKLYLSREKRIHPYKDTKILTDWNGLMITALAKGAQVFQEKSYETAAIKALEFILSKMCSSEGKLLHRYKDGDAAITASVDDYNFLIWGLIEIYETNFDIKYLKTAIELNKIVIDHYWDNKDGAFYFTPDYGEKLITRQKESYDGAVPSGNSVGMYNLLRLARITGDISLEEKALKISRLFSSEISQVPMTYTQLMVALLFSAGPSYEVVITGDLQAQDTEEMIKEIRKTYVPNKVLIFVPSAPQESEIGKIAEFTRNLNIMDGKATAYVCSNYTCNIGTTNPEELIKLLDV